MKELVVGDPHATVEDLDDCERLMDLVEHEAFTRRVDHVVILGDLFHNHSLMNVKVLAFWERRISTLARNCKVILLRGNHDMMGDGSDFPHALVTFKGRQNVLVVDEPFVVKNRAFLPYIQNPNLFIEQAHKLFTFGCKSLICHQEFTGAMYDNGFYAPNGVDPGQVPFQSIVSGHIHTPQTFGSVWYVGAPRWRTLSDADVPDRNIWVLEYDVAGNLLSKLPISCLGFCRAIKKLVLKPDQPLPLNHGERDLLHVTIEGPQDFIKEAEIAVRKELPKARIMTVATDDRVIRVRESDGIPVAFRKYVEAYIPKRGTNRELLTKLAQERLYV